MEKISVIIPAYNAEKYIGEAIDSVLAQTYPVYEIIVVDDGSTDRTAEIVKEIASAPAGPRNDAGKMGQSHSTRKRRVGTAPIFPIIRYLYQDNRGPAAARNRGIKESTGDYIAFLDSDDIWLPEKMMKQMRLFRGSGYAMVYCDMAHALNNMVVHNSYLKERGYKHYGDKDVYLGLLRENFIFTPTVVMKRAVVDTVGGFDENYKICEDYKMWLSIAKRFKIGFVNNPLVIRRRHEDNITKDKYLYTMSRVKVLNELLADNENSQKVKSIVRRELNEVSFNLGYWQWKRDEISEARANFLRSIKCGKKVLRSTSYIIASYLPKQLLARTKSVNTCQK